MREKLQEYALLAEIISAICIVLSLIFVGLQVQLGAEETAANTEALRSQVRESMLDSDMNILSLAIEAPMLMKQGIATSDMSEEEKMKRMAYFYMIARTREHYYNQYQRGFMDDAAYESYRIVLIDEILNTDFYLDLWRNVQVKYADEPGFLNEINALLRERGVDL